MSWPSVVLSSVARLERDGEAPSALPPETRYVGLEHLDGDGAIAASATVGTAELKSTKFRFCEDHILYGKLRPYLRKIARPGFAGVCSTDIIPIRPSAAIDRGYLFHFLRTPQMVDVATSRCAGANLPRLSPSQLEKFEIPLPPLPEQKRIAAILDAADALRAKRRESIEQLDSLVQATFLEMFGDPVTNPRGWDVREMADLVDIDADMVDPTDIRYRGLLHYGPDRITRDTGELLPAQTAAQDGLTSGKFLCKPGHVLYSTKIRPYLNKVAIVNEACLCSADVYPVSPRHDIVIKEFLWVVLRSGSFLGYIESCAGRANIPKINRKEFMAYRCLSPPMSLQTRFASIVESIEHQKATLKAHLAELDALFSSLQSRAFNGELVA